MNRQSIYSGHNADIDDKCLQRKMQHYKFMSDWKYDLLNTIYRSRGESTVNRGLEPRSGQAKDYLIGICCFSAKPNH
jgi:hypothetical protein